MTQAPSEDHPDTVAREISDWHRRFLAIIGLMSWIAGGVIAFRNTNGAGAAAFIVAGVVCVVLALVGRWPSQISLSGSALSWDDVKKTVNSQIEVAEKSGEPDDVLEQLKVLRDRLDKLQHTGSVPELPAEAYDKSVKAALRRLLPGFEVSRQPSRSRSIADFVVRDQQDQVFVETKWRGPGKSFGGSTLPRLTQNLPLRPNSWSSLTQITGDQALPNTWRMPWASEVAS